MLRENPYGDILADDQFKTCLKIFMDAVLWKTLEHTKDEGIKARLDSAEALGNALRKVVLEFTGIDTHELYK